MSQSYSFFGYPQFSGYGSYVDFHVFQHHLIANSFNHALERFEKKFFSNLNGNWKFQLVSDGITKTFYFDGSLKRFSDFNPVVQLFFNDIIL